MKDLWMDYRDWLLREKLSLPNKLIRDNDVVFDMMHNEVDFFWDQGIPFDRNRELDGLYLRKYYMNEIGADGLRFDRRCSFLEFFTALMCRLRDEYIGMQDDFLDFFCDVLVNLGVFKCENCEIIVKKITFMLKRDFTFHGEGGLFPLKNTNSDQRKEEIWAQAMKYLSENGLF